MPDRKKVIVAFVSWATVRKCENRWLSSSPAPSQENTTNCGGCSPGTSRSGVGWLGWGPVSEVGPSPINRALTPALAGLGWARGTAVVALVRAAAAEENGFRPASAPTATAPATAATPPA